MKSEIKKVFEKVNNFSDMYLKQQNHNFYALFYFFAKLSIVSISSRIILGNVLIMFIPKFSKLGIPCAENCNHADTLIQLFCVVF